MASTSTSCTIANTVTHSADVESLDGSQSRSRKAAIVSDEKLERKTVLKKRKLTSTPEPDSDLEIMQIQKVVQMEESSEDSDDQDADSDCSQESMKKTFKTPAW